MNAKKTEHTPFKDRLQTRRICEYPQRKVTRRGSVYTCQIAEVLVRMAA